MCSSSSPSFLISSLAVAVVFLVVSSFSSAQGNENLRENVYTNFFDPLTRRYSHFPEFLRLQMLEETRQMFKFGFDCYMKCAFPLDELDPIACRGRGPDREDPSNININDVLGGYSLALVESLGTLAVMGDRVRFRKAVRDVVENVSFDGGATVQVFEANIRVLGGLLSAHLLMEDESKPFGDLTPDWYMGDLLTLAHDLADRLLSAFSNPDGGGATATGLPHPRVNLVSGVPSDGYTTTCTAGAGSLVLEMGVVSRLLGDPTYESYARRAALALWELRDNSTGLTGNVVDIHTGEWVSKLSGLGAGMDSYYEYLLKSHVLFDSPDLLRIFSRLYASARAHMRKGRQRCNVSSGMHPIYINVDMRTGAAANAWVDSLQAALPGLQVLHGHLEEAICQHALYYALWLRYGALPERYNWKEDRPEIRFYPLRPEFMEATYFLYQATKSPFYLHVGRDIIASLNNHTRSNCGYATIHDVLDKTLEDRQESFFLSETCKYLYLLFDRDNPANKLAEKYLFTTEGHLFPVSPQMRRKVWEEEGVLGREEEEEEKERRPWTVKRGRRRKKEAGDEGHDKDDPGDGNFRCENPGPDSVFELPLRSRYLAQILGQFGLLDELV